MLKRFFASLAVLAGLYAAPVLIASPAAANGSPCQWNYAFDTSGNAQATYCGAVYATSFNIAGGGFVVATAATPTAIGQCVLSTVIGSNLGQWGSCGGGGSTLPAANITYTATGTGAQATNLDTMTRQYPLTVWQFLTVAQILDVRAYTDSVDTTAGIQACINAMIAQGVSCYAPQGMYLANTAQIVIDYASNPYRGVKFYSDGFAEIDMRGSSANPPFLMEMTGGSPGTPAGETYNGLGPLHFDCATAGSCIYLGTGNFADALNEGAFYLSIQNFNTSSSSSCININYVLSSYGKMNCATAAGPTGGNVGFILNQLNFDTFTFGGSNMQIMQLWGGGTNTSNTIIGQDCEIVSTCLEISGGNVQHNKWIGGTWAYSVNGVIATGGFDNEIDSPGVNATATNFFSGSAGTYVSLRYAQTGLPTCSTGCSSVTGVNAERFAITTSTGATSVSVAFSPTWPYRAPQCIAQGTNGVNIPFISSVSAGALGIGFPSAATTTIYVNCVP